MTTLRAKEQALAALEKEYNQKRQAIIEAFALIESLGSQVPSEPSVTANAKVAEEYTQSLVEMAVGARTGSDVARIRKAMGMTQAEFACLWGSTQANVSTMENKNGALRRKSQLKISQIVQAYMSR